jgi:deoxyribose-phosphate aldolase
MSDHEITRQDIERLIAAIDYSEALTIDAARDDVVTACGFARQYGFRAVVVFPHHLGLVVEQLQGTPVLPQLAVGFPCGGQTTYVKCKEAEEGLKTGARDLDMVMNIGAFKGGDYQKVERDIAEVLAVARPYDIPTKVIVEVGVLTEEEKVTAAKLVADSGADFIKTCTGYAVGRATLHDVVLFKKLLGDRLRIKASGLVAGIEDGVGFMWAGASVVAMRKVLVDQLRAMDWS